MRVLGPGVHAGGWRQVEGPDLVEARGATEAEERNVVFDVPSEIGCCLLVASYGGFELCVIGVTNRLGTDFRDFKDFRKPAGGDKAGVHECVLTGGTSRSVDWPDNLVVRRE